jgi:hypothetical protein
VGEAKTVPLGQRGSPMTITIKAARDAEAGVWYIANGDLPGLNLEGESLDELYNKLFHGIEAITGEPKVEFELLIFGTALARLAQTPDLICPGQPQTAILRPSEAQAFGAAAR